ncbi:outer membrane lipoprotein carrier protein LolA [Paludibacter sp. 221]|uniref:LolA family protein n=1 Tax=Paludibacter sp. 221 TaxID=2302939 RepID=UPI0013D43147|nr:outer membrane lipoprotein carrier protein LolA [Paludibacter sp. 221]
MKLKYGCLFLLLCLFQVGFAQNDKQAAGLVADFIKSVEEGALSTEFVLTVFGDNDMPVQSQSGLFVMKKGKFSMETQEFTVYFDGKTQWMYSPSVNEVSITEPTEEELAEINPIIILRDYQNKSKIGFSAAEKSAENYVIEMTPVETSSDYNNIVVWLSKSSKTPLSIKMVYKNGYEILIVFDNFQKGIKIPENFFVFDKKNYEGVIENDLR